MCANHGLLEDARKLMSHEHKALGFRPPPGSLAAEAQAAAAKTNGQPRRNSNEAGRKPRQNSIGANGGLDGKARRASESPRKQRRGSNETNGQTSRRGSNESQASECGSNGIKRTTSDQTGIKETNGSDTGRRVSTMARLSSVDRQELLREAALRDAERIK